MSRKKEHHEEHADESWLLPYSDLLTLLLALFIVMFAMSQVDKEKFEQTSQQFNVIFSGTSFPATSTTVNNITIEEDKMIEIKESIEEEIRDNEYSDKVKVLLNNEGLEISIQDVVLFNSGDAEVLEGISPLLLQISRTLNGLNNNIKVVGHTDNIPIHNEKFRSNWDLSAMRAVNVMGFLIDQGGLDPKRFSFQGYGQYSPKFDNSTAEGRGKNRRVEIFLIRKFTHE
jgi:chemotaxis protein MotB